MSRAVASLYISGQVPVHAEGNPYDDIRAQARQVFRNLRAPIEEAVDERHRS